MDIRQMAADAAAMREPAFARPSEESFARGREAASEVQAIADPDGLFAALLDGARKFIEGHAELGDADDLDWRMQAIREHDEAHAL